MVKVSKSFLKSSTIYTLAGALPMASAILLLPLYILYLPTEVYGALGICLASAAIVQVITAYSFDSSLYIHYHELKAEPQKLQSFISSSFIFMLAWGVALIAVLGMAGQLIFTTVLSEEGFSFFPYGFMSVGIGVFQALFKVHGNLLQTREKPEAFLWSNVVSFTIIAVTTFVGLKLFPGTLIGPLGGRLMAALLSALWSLFRVFREFGFHFKSPWQYTSVRFNAFTFIYQIQQWVINYLDRFIILFFIPASAMSLVGVYEFAIKCLAPVELLLNGLNASVFPQVIKLIGRQEGSKSSSPEINRYFYGQVSVMMLVICLSIIFLPLLADLFIRKSNYREALEYIPYIAVTFVLRSIRLYFVLPYNILKKMQRLTMINFAVSFLKIILMILMITKWGIFGIIISSALTYAVEIIFLWYFLRRDYAMKFNGLKLVAGPLLLLLVVVMTEPFIPDEYITAGHLSYGVICASLLWFLYRHEFKMINFKTFLK